MAEYKCHSCDKPMRVQDLKYDRDWCLQCWKEHLESFGKKTTKRLTEVNSRLINLQD